MINEFSSAGILDVAQNACLRGCVLTPAGEALKEELDARDKGKFHFDIEHFLHSLLHRSDYAKLKDICIKHGIQVNIGTVLIVMDEGSLSELGIGS